MRSPLLALLLVSSIFVFPAASAKSLAEDPQGDVVTDVFGAPALPGALPGADAVDLLALDITEDAEELAFALKVAKLDQTVSFSSYEIGFAWQAQEFRVIVQRAVAQGALEENSNAYLLTSSDDRDRFNGFAELSHEIDVANNMVRVYLPKVYILNEKGRFPLLGDELKDMYVEARSHATIFQFTAESYDRMPDGSAMLKYPFLFGDVASGHLRVDADERVRVSNGGATTFVYQVVISNKGDLDDDVTIRLTDLPSGWNGTVQSPLRLPGGGERRVAVLMSVPFGHEHGGFSSFNVSVTSQRDPQSFGSIRVGVLHTPIPQPAGHHSELYLHAQKFNAGVLGDVFPFTGTSMNAESSHEGDAAEASPRSGGGGGFVWQIPLAPSLRMGLDFDLERLGAIEGSLVGHSATSTGRVSATLHLVAEGDEMNEMDEGLLLAESDSVDIALALNAASPFKLTLTPNEESDYIPYMRGQNLMLKLVYDASEDDAPTICCLATTPGLSTADFKLTLPLNEYHDKLQGLTETIGSIELKPEGAVEKAGLPGTTLTYAFTLINHGKEPQLIDVDLAGTDAALGTLVPASAVELAPQESKKITLAVAIPTGRNAGEEIEVLLFAHAQADPSKSAIARTKTVIAKAGASDVHSDESGMLLAAQQAEENDTPAPGLALVLAAIGVALLAVRRRR